MFVSSYSTYIQTGAANKNIRQKDTEYENRSALSSKLYEKNTPALSSGAPFAVDYIAKNNNFYTKLFLEKNQDEQSAQTKELTHKFIDQSTLQDAKKAYTQLPKMSSFFRETFIAFDKTQTVASKSSQETQESKDTATRKLMIDTYIANDNYYKISA